MSKKIYVTVFVFIILTGMLFGSSSHDRTKIPKTFLLLTKFKTFYYFYNGFLNMDIAKYLKNRFSIKMRKFYSDFRDNEFNMLDVGCGNHSVELAKYYFPKVHYYGVDNCVYNNSLEDFNKMDKFYNIDLEKNDLQEIPNNFFDLINCSHVIEHINNGLEVVEKLIPKLKKQGKIYLEFPSERSLILPNARKGTLNFCDDKSHVYVHSIRELSNLLLKNKMFIIQAGKPIDLFRILFCAPITFPYQVYSFIRYGKITAKWGIVSLLGFANYVYAVKKE